MPIEPVGGATRGTLRCLQPKGDTVRTTGIPLTDAAKAALGSYLRCRFATVAEQLTAEPYGTPVDELRATLQAGATELDRIRVLEQLGTLDAPPDEALGVIAGALTELRLDRQNAIDLHDERVAEDRINALEQLAQDLADAEPMTHAEPMEVR